MIKIFPFFFIVLWSSAFITTKPIIDNSEPFSALAFRFLFVALGFYIFTIYTKQKIFVPQKKIIESVLSGILFHGFYLGGVFYALSNGASASLIALIVSLQPILTSTLARFFLNENLSRLQWLGIFLGFLGALIVILTDLNNDLTLLAFCAGLIGLLSSSLGIIWQKKIVSDLSLSANNFIQALSASIFHFILAMCFENYFLNFTSSFIIAMSWQIFAVSLGAFLILMWLLQHNKANEISTLFFLVPPISAMMAFLILDETFVMLDLIGLFISSIGVFIVSKYKSKI